MNKIVKVTYFISDFFPNYNGRTIRAYNICKFVNDHKKFKVIIITPYLSDFKKRRISKNEKIDSLLVFRFKPFNFLKILRVLIKERIEIIHFRYPLYKWTIYLFFAKILGISVVMEDHSTHTTDNIIKRLEYKLILKISKHIITISNYLRKFYLKVYNKSKSSISTIYNGINLEKFSLSNIKIKKSELKEKYNLANKWVVGFFGTYYDWEGLNLLIKAIYKIHQKGKSINGLFIGHGPEESKLLDLVKKFNLQDIIKFTGPINYNEIQNYINLLDIFISPRPHIKEFSYITPLKVLEVMGLKKSIIASDLPGFRKVIKNNFTGLLIEPNNIGDLVKKILILFNNPLMMKEIGENAFKFIEKNYSWKIMIKPLLKIYKKLSKN